MFLRANKRSRWQGASLLEHCRELSRGGMTASCQRPVLYLGEINDSQHAAWFGRLMC